jgi:hypothetical protein
VIDCLVFCMHRRVSGVGVPRRKSGWRDEREDRGRERRARLHCTRVQHPALNELPHRDLFSHLSPFPPCRSRACGTEIPASHLVGRVPTELTVSTALSLLSVRAGEGYLPFPILSTNLLLYSQGNLQQGRGCRVIQCIALPGPGPGPGARRVFWRW